MKKFIVDFLDDMRDVCDEYRGFGSELWARAQWAAGWVLRLVLLVLAAPLLMDVVSALLTAWQPGPRTGWPLWIESLRPVVMLWSDDLRAMWQAWGW